MKFTKRELELLSELLAGKTRAEISAAWCRSPKTVSAHLHNMRRRNNAKTEFQLAALAAVHIAAQKSI